MKPEIAHMKREDLLALQAAIAERLVYLANTDVKPAREALSTAGTQTGDGRRGSFELKTINGYGPYAYLRYWEGGHLRSKYLGKADKVAAKRL